MRFEDQNLWKSKFKYKKNYKTKNIHQGNKTIHQGNTPICIIRYDMLKWFLIFESDNKDIYAYEVGRINFLPTEEAHRSTIYS